MNILITGGLGHIGSRLLNSFHEHKLFVVDNLSTQRYSSLFNLKSSGEIFFFEKSTQEISPEWLASIDKIDLIIHLAATTDAAGNVNNRDALFENNFLGTIHISELALKLGIKIIFPSSTSVYGSQSKVVDESCLELLPQSPYAESKLAEENFLIDKSKVGLQALILRFGTIHGISPGMRFHTAVNRFLFQAKLGVPLTVWRTALNQKRPYLSLDDCVSSILHSTKNIKFDGSIYNIVTRNWTVAEIINKIEIELGRSCRINLVDAEIMNQLSYEVSAEKFQNTGFEFKGNIEFDIRQSLNLLKVFPMYSFSPSNIKNLGFRSTSKFSDIRGYFMEIARSSDLPEYVPKFTQDSISYSRSRVLRGMHLQDGQWQLVTLLKGSILDVTIDIKPDSETFLQIFTIRMASDSSNQLLVPPGVAHGFCVTSQEAIIHYKSTVNHGESREHGFSWESDILKTMWPNGNWVISQRDSSLIQLSDFLRLNS